MLRRRARYRHDHRARLVLALGLVALAGCGGDDSENEDFSPVVADPLSKVEFLRQADQICFSSESRVEAAADDLLGQSEPDPAEVERIALNIAVPALEAEVRAIRALGAPEGDEAEVEAILKATERGIAEIEADPRGLADGPPSGLREAQKLAERYGSQECGFR